MGFEPKQQCVCSDASAFNGRTTNELQISDAIRRFGVNDKTTVLLVVKVLSGPRGEESREGILAAMQAVVEGELLPLSSLPDFTDWTAVKKVQLVGFICGFF
jgi:hypothetical protein